jgi:hypothetical protein
MVRLSRFRRLARSVAVLLLLAAPSGLLHAGSDDFACLPGATADGGATLGAAGGDTADHCLVCHWTRSLRSPSPPVARIHAALVAATPIDESCPIAQRAPALDRLPARAPPRSL